MPLGQMLDSSASSPTPKPAKPAPAPKAEKPKLASWLTGDAPETANLGAPTVSEQVDSAPTVTPESLLAQSTPNVATRSYNPAALEQAQAISTEQAREDARALAEQQLGLNDPKRNKAYRMTTDEYLALSPKQRAAIDFNTALVTAVRQDRRNQEQYGRTLDKGIVAVSGEGVAGEEQRKQYEADIESMFGKGRDSDMYAPATVALLKDIGYENANADLDDFLNLKVAITDKDLKNFNATYGTGTKEYTLSGVPGVQTEESQGYVLDGKIVDSPKFSLQNQLTRDMQARLDEVLKRGEMILGTTFQTLQQARADEVSSYGGLVPSLAGQGAGFSPGNPHTGQFQSVFDELGANKANLTPESLGALNQMWTQNGVDPDTFWTYVNQRIDQAAVEGGTLGSVGYQPDEMRKILGLEPKGR